MQLRWNFLHKKGNFLPICEQTNTPLSHEQLGLIFGTKVKLFDFVKESFVADLQDFGRTLSIPARLYREKNILSILLILSKAFSGACA